MEFLFVQENQIENLPASVGSLPQLRLLDVSRNQLTALPPLLFSQLETLKAADNQLQELPTSIAGLASLREVELNDNQLEELPAGLIDLPQLELLGLRRNFLDFADLEPLVGQVQQLLIAPQNGQPGDEQIIASAGNNLTLNANIGGSQNSYQWFKDGIEIAGATSAEYTFRVGRSSLGVYTARVTNSLVPQVEISTRQLEVLLDCTTNRSISLETANPTEFCAGEAIAVNFEAVVTGGVGTMSYQWYRNDTPIPLATNRTYFVAAPGVYAVAVTGVEGCRSFSSPVEVVRFPVAQIELTTEGDSLVSAVSIEGGSYQWYLNDEAIEGATAATLVADESGIYRLRYLLPNGCEQFSRTVNFTVTGLKIDPGLTAALKVYPVPVTDLLFVELPYSSGQLERAVLRSATGQEVLRQEGLNGQQTQLSLHELPSGTYLLELYTQQGQLAIRHIVKQ